MLTLFPAAHALLVRKGHHGRAEERHKRRRCPMANTTQHTPTLSELCETAAYFVGTLELASKIMAEAERAKGA
jgi:hypothetical protein